MTLIASVGSNGFPDGSVSVIWHRKPEHGMKLYIEPSQARIDALEKALEQAVEALEQVLQDCLHFDAINLHQVNEVIVTARKTLCANVSIPTHKARQRLAMQTRRNE